MGILKFKLRMKENTTKPHPKRKEKKIKKNTETLTQKEKAQQREQYDEAWSCSQTPKEEDPLLLRQV